MSITVYPRSAWTSTAPGFPRYSGRKITPSRVTHLRLHYPGDGNHTRAHYTKAQSEQALRNYRSFHVNTRRWADIGYPLAVDQSGRAWVAAGTTHAAAHSATGARPNENWHSLAILLIIGNNERPSAAMIATVNAIWAGLLDGSLGLGRFPNMRTVTAHNDVPGASTRCAGPQVDALLRQGAFDASKRTPAPAPTPERTWFDMATKNDLRDVVRDELNDLFNQRIKLTGSSKEAFGPDFRAGALLAYAARGGLTAHEPTVQAVGKLVGKSTSEILAAIAEANADVELPEEDDTTTDNGENL